MYGIFTYIWLIFRANVGKYTIHGAYGFLIGAISIIKNLVMSEPVRHKVLPRGGHCRRIGSTATWADGAMAMQHRFQPVFSLAICEPYIYIHIIWTYIYNYIHIYIYIYCIIIFIYVYTVDVSLYIKCWRITTVALQQSHVPTTRRACHVNDTRGRPNIAPVK